MKSQIKTGVILGYINMVASIVISLIYVPVVLKLVGQSEYGLYSLVASIIGYLSVLDMGFGNAMVRFVSKSKAKSEIEKERKINGLFLTLYSIIGIVAFIIGLVLMMNVGNIFKALTVAELAKAKILMIILVVTVSVSFPLSIFDSYVMASEKFTFAKLLQLIKTILLPLTIFIVLKFGYKSIGMVIVSSSFKIMVHISSMIYCFKKLKMKIYFSIKNIDKRLLKEVIVYSFFIFLNILVTNLYNNTDQVILGAVSGTVAVSIYAVATKITTINQKFSTNISGVFFPRITKTLEQKDGVKKASDIFIKVSRIQLYLLSLILFGFILIGKSFIAIWVGKKYIDAFYIILLLIGPSLIPLTQNIGISIIQAMNRHKFRSVVYLIIAILNIFISIPLAKKYGGVGAATGTAIATFLGQIFTMNIYYYKVVKIDIPTYWKRFVKFFLPMATAVLIFHYYTKDIYFNFTKVIIIGASFMLIYLLYCIPYLNNEEKQYISKIMRKIKIKK